MIVAGKTAVILAVMGAVAEAAVLVVVAASRCMPPPWTELHLAVLQRYLAAATATTAMVAVVCAVAAALVPVASAHRLILQLRTAAAGSAPGEPDISNSSGGFDNGSAGASDIGSHGTVAAADCRGGQARGTS